MPKHIFCNILIVFGVISMGAQNTQINQKKKYVNDDSESMILFFSLPHAQTYEYANWNFQLINIRINSKWSSPDYSFESTQNTHHSKREWIYSNLRNDGNKNRARKIILCILLFYLLFATGHSCSFYVHDSIVAANYTHIYVLYGLPHSPITRIGCNMPKKGN